MKKRHFFYKAHQTNMPSVKSLANTIVTNPRRSPLEYNIELSLHSSKYLGNWISSLSIDLEFFQSPSTQPQHPPFSASGFSSLVLVNPTQSSAIVGCIPMHESSCSLVIPHFMAIPSPCVISPAFGAHMWKPTTLLSALVTITFV